MEKKWELLPEISQDFKNEFPEIHPVILQLLHNRGISTQEKIDEFLNPDYGQYQHDPFLFNDMKKAVDRIYQALENQEKIAIYGDYDADGVTSTALLYTALSDLGFEDIEVYIPYRMTEGYGMNEKAVKELAKQGRKLIITVDCGIANKEEITLAAEKGMDVIVTDHHHEPVKSPDKAYAIINPKVKNEKYPFKDLAGVGVAFKLIQGLIKEAKNHHVDLPQGYEKWLLDFVAIGTVADCVDVLGENRVLVRYGLVVLNKTKRSGLKKLIEKARLIPGSLEGWNISFQLGPRLNAAGRMEHALTSYHLLISSDEEETTKLVDGLEKTNRERQKITEKMVNEAREQIEKRGTDKSLLYAIKKGWSPGLVGLVAGKLADEYYRPVLIFGEGKEEIIASGRSIPEFNIIEAIESINQHLKEYGGHAQACGLTVQKKEDMKIFIEELTKIADKKLKNIDLAPKIIIDTEIKLDEADHDFLIELHEFQPYGEGNKIPKFIIKDLKVVSFDKVGKKSDHLRLMVSQNGGTVKKCIGFYLGSICDKINVGGKVDVVCEVSFNEWNGTKEIQLKIIDLKTK